MNGELRNLCVTIINSDLKYKKALLNYNSREYGELVDIIKNLSIKYIKEADNYYRQNQGLPINGAYFTAE